MSGERWRPVNEFPDLYLISDLGRVYSLTKQRLLPSQRHTGGYRKILFTVNSKWYNRYIHRLVAEHFLDDWDASLQVNHIDGDKTNNCFSNLEMVTPAQNIKHAHVSGIGGAHHLHHKGGNPARPVEQYTLDGEFVAKYQSTFQAQKATGVSSGNLSHVASGTRKTAGGFLWKWAA